MIKLRIKYDEKLMKFISLFGYLTQAKVKDCLEYDHGLLFVVEPNEIGKAIGKHGLNVKKIEGAVKKKIRIVEFNPEKLSFIKNLIYPLKAKEIKEDENGVVTIAGPDTKTKGLIIGRNAKNLRFYENVARRYFDLKEIRVV